MAKWANHGTGLCNYAEKMLKAYGLDNPFTASGAVYQVMAKTTKNVWDAARHYRDYHNHEQGIALDTYFDDEGVRHYVFSRSYSKAQEMNVRWENDARSHSQRGARNAAAVEPIRVPIPLPAPKKVGA